MKYNLKDPIRASLIKFKFVKPAVTSTVVMERIHSDFENLTKLNQLKSKTAILKHIAKKFSVSFESVRKILEKKSPYDVFFND